MFERFTEDARQVVVEAQAEARALRHGWIGTEHLLLAALRPGVPLRDVLGQLGVTHENVRQDLGSRSAGAPGAALRDLGIDVDEVRRRVEAVFGPGALDAPPARRRRWFRRRERRGGHISFTTEAKRALERSLREALDLRSRDIRAEHILLGILRDEGQVTATLRRLGVDRSAVRRALLSRLGNAA